MPRPDRRAHRAVLLLALLCAGPLALGGAAPAAPPARVPPDDPRPLDLDSLTHYYARRQPAAIARLLQRAQTREERLLCSYRLYPLTRDEALVADIPAASGAGTAREAALIAAMWAFRASEAPLWRLPTFGRRIEHALARARRLDPDDPYVLLVEGQGLLYKPAVFGGDPAAARARFERLRSVLARRPPAGIHPFEAEVWIWMALRRTGSPAAEPLRRRLLAQAPPPLFRQFLLDPP
jgi:hypothetical protein